jgi:hypothetical protein
MIDAAIAPAIESPAAVAATRPMRSIRRNAYSPRPASRGLKTMNARIAAPGDRAANSRLGGAYSHPDCGSAAYGVPVMSKGFHSGT